MTDTKRRNAEIQNTYRQRCRDRGGKRLDMWIDEDVFERLEFLMGWHSMTKKEVISFAIDKMYQAVQRKIERDRYRNEVYFDDNMTEEAKQDRERLDDQVLVESLIIEKK